MNKAKAMKWVKALRSGKYKQGREVLLKTQNDSLDGKVVGHCCLGVLAEINGFGREKLCGLDLLNIEMQEVCGLTSESGEPLNNDDGDPQKVNVRHAKMDMEFDSLAEANDHGVSFRTIATWIEKNYKLL